MSHLEKLKSYLEEYGKYIIIAAFLLITASIIKQFFYFKEIKENKKETVGTIEKFEYSSRGSYSLYFKYNIDGKTYSNSIGTNGFYGFNKRKGCVGCEFKVLYSSKDHRKSSIRLGKYEKHKRTVEFVNLDE
ncbi:hypothetical protein [Flavobacterium sp.]|uniref:hypothetical protein n=1 Tax=Flavobacterium sp. TaxID=239 RepID=UPI0028BDE69E|nr:hypothetical protein [Flavobacterium sp.]